MGRVIPVGDAAFGDSFEAIPVGTKLKVAVFDISETAVKSGENAGKPQLVVNFKVTEEGPYLGREIRYNNLPLYDGKGAWALVAFAEAVGWATSKETGVDVPDNVSDVLGTELIIKVGIRSDQQGNVYNRSAGYHKAGTGTTKPVVKDAAKTWGEV